MTPSSTRESISSTVSGREKASTNIISDGSRCTTFTGCAEATGFGEIARLSIAEAIKVFSVLRRKVTFRQNSVVLASSLTETALAPPSIRTVVSAREVPQTSITENRLTGETASSTGGSKSEVFFTAGVPVNFGRSRPS